MIIQTGRKKLDNSIVGKFALCEPAIYHTFCGLPWKITAVSESGQRVYLERDCRQQRHIDRGDPPEIDKKYVMSKSILMVADTIEEGRAVYELGMEQREAVLHAIRTVEDEFQTKLYALLDKK